MHGVRVPTALTVAAGITGCSGPQSTLDPAGPAALSAAWLWWAMFAVSSVVLVAVVALWLYAIFFRKTRSTDEADARRTARRWVIGGGIVLPMASITLLLLFGIPAGHRMLPLPVEGQQPLVVEVIGHQWWWEVHYPESGVTTANELHLPVGVPVDVHATSADVIHSFWVPVLAGKIDMQPARTHVHRIQSDQVGSFRGQCSEFCGLYHAHMVLAVEVHSQDGFEQWLQHNVEPVTVPAAQTEVANAFQEHCGDCHRIAGLSEGGLAPDLSNIGSRSLLGGRPRTEDDSIAFWLRNHPRAKLGAPIPDHSEMAPGQLDAIADWLETLTYE